MPLNLNYTKYKNMDKNDKKGNECIDGVCIYPPENRSFDKQVKHKETYNENVIVEPLQTGYYSEAFCVIN